MALLGPENCLRGRKGLRVWVVLKVAVVVISAACPQCLSVRSLVSAVAVLDHLVYEPELFAWTRTKADSADVKSTVG